MGGYFFLLSVEVLPPFVSFPSTRLHQELHPRSSHWFCTGVCVHLVRFLKGVERGWVQKTVGRKVVVWRDFLLRIPNPHDCCLWSFFSRSRRIGVCWKSELWRFLDENSNSVWDNFEEVEVNVVGVPELRRFFGKLSKNPWWLRKGRKLFISHLSASNLEKWDTFPYFLRFLTVK